LTLKNVSHEELIGIYAYCNLE